MKKMKKINLDFEKMGGLLPTVIQDGKSRDVLMVGFMNKKAWEKTLSTGKVTFWSRTRNTLWTKGETSGNYLDVRDIFLDCDCDTLLIKVNPQGPVCHLGTRSCFERKIK